MDIFFYISGILALGGRIFSEKMQGIDTCVSILLCNRTSPILLKKCSELFDSPWTWGEWLRELEPDVATQGLCHLI